MSMNQTPALTHCFSVDITPLNNQTQITNILFQSASGLSSTISTKPVYVGGRIAPFQLFEKVSYGDVELKAGLSKGSDALWKWHRAWATRGAEYESYFFRATVTLTQYSPSFEELCKWTFEEAWPSSWTGGNFNAEKGELHIQTLKLSHNGMTLHEGKTQS